MQVHCPPNQRFGANISAGLIYMYYAADSNLPQLTERLQSTRDSNIQRVGLGQIYGGRPRDLQGTHEERMY